ncbi:MAG: hypothetical protein Q8K99_04715 [Actinomycetota bacterium]|nr:hypothetical protein [Actinomycetota bacterium]
MQTTVDEIVRSWPDVRAKNIFGHRGYMHGRRLFGFLAVGGVTVKAYDDDFAAALYARDGVRAFAYADTEMRGWPVLPLRGEADLEAALSTLKDAYDAVGAGPPGHHTDDD